MSQQTPQEAVKKASAGLDKGIDMIAKFVGVLSIIFIVVGIISFFFYFISGIVKVANIGNFLQVVNGLANAISAFMRYLFYAAVTLIGAKLIKK